MKAKILFTTLLSLGLVFTACEDDDSPAKPVVEIHELGDGHHYEAQVKAIADEGDDHHTAVIGEDLHIDAEIVAEGKIEKIIVELHSEATDDELEIEFEGKYVGTKNAEFHEHIEIPETFAAGEYHFHLEVIDMKGQTGSDEEHIDLVEPTK
ncbi:MAG: DUF4625 domain-containing protein [Carboxylicivirga sp.]|jgi:hypothetical protein|nr:DUF4625 domain-containing protein [Carboxylicivirga sp.]